jgi:hypothetical protein
MYTNIVTCVRACDDKSDAFSIKIGLHQGLALSTYIFTLVMVLIDESRIGVDQKLELLRQTLESKGFRLS